MFCAVKSATISLVLRKILITKINVLFTLIQQAMEYFANRTFNNSFYLSKHYYAKFLHLFKHIKLIFKCFGKNDFFIIRFYLFKHVNGFLMCFLFYYCFFFNICSCIECLKILKTLRVAGNIANYVFVCKYPNNNYHDKILFFFKKYVLSIYLIWLDHIDIFNIDFLLLF